MESLFLLILLLISCLFTPTMSSIPDCPLECDCDQQPPLNKTTAVYCHKGGINDTRFAELLLQLPVDIKTLDVQSPSWRPPSKIKWNDNLNRFKDLRTLRLVDLKIPSMSRSVRLPKLETLDLTGNNIDHATMGNFAGLPSLQHLDLTSNKLSILPTGVFSYLKNLKTLSVANNSMQELPTNLLHGLRNLKSLHLDNNKLPIKHVNDLFTDVPQLEELYLNDCGVHSVANISFNRVPKLTHLGLAGNGLRNIPSEELEALHNLAILDLSNNEIGDIPPCAFCANNLTHLIISRNVLGIGKEPFHADAFRDTSIVSLDISHNHLNDFDSTWLGHAQFTIEELKFGGNYIRAFPSQITHTLTKLRSLDMSSNHIEWWPVSLPPEYHLLESLNVSGNEFANLPDNVGLILPNLRQLDLSHNQFTSLSHSALMFINELDKVYLHENPWDCSCSIHSIQQHMKDRYGLRHHLRYDETQCAAPLLLRGQPLLNVQEVSDCAILFGARYGLTQNSELLLLSAALLAAAAMLCILLLALYYTRERQYKGTYVTREHSRTPLTMTHPMSMSPSNASEPLTPTPSLPPPPPKAAAAYFGI